MAREVNCPHCGCPLLAVRDTVPDSAWDTVRVPDSDTVEVLQREIEHLRATVARLRGAGFNPLQRRGAPVATHPRHEP